MLAGNWGCASEINCTIINSAFSWTRTIPGLGPFFAMFPFSFYWCRQICYVSSRSLSSFSEMNIQWNLHEWSVVLTGHVHCSNGTSLYVMAFKIKSIAPLVQATYFWLLYVQASERLYSDSLRNLKTLSLSTCCDSGVRMMNCQKKAISSALFLSSFCFCSCTGWLQAVFHLIANQWEHPSGKVIIAQLWSCRPSTVVISGLELDFILPSGLWSKYSVFCFLSCKPLLYTGKLSDLKSSDDDH